MTRKTTIHTLSLVACGLLLVLAAPSTAWSDQGFRLWVDPIDLWVLETDIDTESAKFEEYRDLGSGLWAGLNLYGASEDGNRNLALRFKGIGREDGRSTLDYRVEGSWALSVDYNKIPHRFGNNGTLLWNQTAVNRFELADPVQQMILDAILDQRASGGRVNFDFLSVVMDPYFATANSVDLGLRRDRTEARLDLGKTGKLAWTVEYRHENRNGNRPLGASFGFNNVQEIPEPIDYDTTDAEVSGEYRGQRSGVRFGYRYSEFENSIDTVVWDNPFRSFDSTDPIAYLGPNTTPNGPATGLTALAPDNESGMLFVDGRTRGDRWWAHGSVVSNRMTQDDPLVPLTTNSAIIGTDERTGQTFNAATSGLPIRAADTEVETLKIAGNGGFELAEDWSLIVRYRYYDYDNTSPRVEFPGYVRMDSAWEAPALITVPYDYTRDNIGVELAWDVADHTSVSLGWDIESWDRTFREIETSDEDTITLSFDSRPSQKVTLRGSYAVGDRSTSEYDVEAQEVFFLDPPGINNQPDLRKYDEAVRDVDDFDFTVLLFPKDAWNLSFGVSGRDEDYPESVFGLGFDELLAYNVEVGYSPGENFNFYLFGHVADREVFQRARQSGAVLSTNPEDDWSVLFNEDNVTWGLGMHSKSDRGWSFDLSAHLSDSDGEADFETPPGGRTAVDFDNYEDIELLTVSAKLGYDLNEKVTLGVGYLYEDYTIDSFILQGLLPYLPQSILLAANEGDYEANVFGINLRVAF